MGNTNPKTMLALLALLWSGAADAQALAGKKVLFINSYHEGYEWSDGEEKGARAALQGTGAELRFLRMDAKRHADEASKKAAGLRAKAEIESFQPSAVIVSDDVAVKYVLEPYFKNGKVPFVFCGVNWDASKYGLPYQNATGILEVSFAREMLETLRPYAKGPRIAYLTVDSETERTEIGAYKKDLGIKFAVERYVKSAAEWKAEYTKLQGEADILFLGNYVGTTDAWSEPEMASFAQANAKIVSGSIYDFMSPYAMVNFAKIAEEHGAWAGKVAADVIRGAAPSSIPIGRNKQSKIVLNPRLASHAGVVFKPDLLRNATIAK